MLPLSVSCALTLILVVLVLLALACLHARPITPTNTVRLTAPIAPEEGSALYDVESIPSGRWGGATGGQWLFQFDARRYTRERFDVFVLRRNGPGLHAPVAHFEVSSFTCLRHWRSVPSARG